MKRYVVGLGNYSKNDDGIGLRVVERIVVDERDVGFEAIELGNDGMALLTLFDEATEYILVVDCAMLGVDPGDYRVFSPEDVESNKQVGRISTHEGDIMKLIALGEELEQQIPRIEVLAIQPESLEMDMRLSGTLEKRLPEYVDVAIRVVAKAGNDA